MKKLMLILALALSMLATVAFADTTVLDDCEDFNTFTSSLTAGDALVYANSVDATEGSSSLEVTFNYDIVPAWTGSSSVIKAFASPTDLSELEFLTYDIKVPTTNAAFMLTLELEDQNGYRLRYVDYGFATATSGWVSKSWKISELEKSQWLTSGHAVDLKHITAINWTINRQAATTATGTFVFYLDNINFDYNTGSAVETVLFDFESYADTTALLADFSTAFTGAATTNLTLETTNAYSGTKAINVEGDPIAQWVSHVAGYDLPSVIDFSAAKYVKFALYGNSATSTYDPTGRIILEDTSGNRAAGYAWSIPKNDEWTVAYMPFNASGAQTWGCWRQDAWDAGGDVDLANITKVYIGFDVQNVTGGETVPVIIDDVVIGYATASPPTPSVNTYAVAQTATPVIDGTVSAGEWDAAGAGCTGFVYHDVNTTPSAEAVSVKALYDADSLYVLWETTEAYAALDFAPTGGARDPSGTSFTGDDYEMFLAPGGNVASDYYHIVFFPNQTDGICYVWDELSAGGPTSWDATGDSAAFSYAGGVMTIEYRVPFSAMNSSLAVVDGSQDWGVQLGFINNMNGSTEYTNWEPDTTAGFAAGRPFGTWSFATVLDVNEWTLY